MNIKTLVVCLGLGTLIGFQSCREDFDYDPISSDLRFNTDTISVDTVYNYSKSETYVLKIYNPDDKDLVIPHISLAKGENSYFNINVDGQGGSDFRNVPIRKKDSLFVFVEMDAKDAPINPFYDDEIIIQTTQNKQHVKLLSWVEKAKIHTTNTSLTTANWTSDEAQVIDGNLTITSNLTIDQGAKVYFKRGSSLTIEPNATLNINGTLGNEVKFRSARHDTKYDSLPNQWNKIELKSNSKSYINYAKIIGADTGIEINNAELDISNSYIVNNQSYGILAKNAKITGYNVLINNANLAAFAVENGGEYSFYHSTFANFFNMVGTAGPAYSLYLSNYSKETTNPLVKATFSNCIFYNQRTPNAVVLDKKEGSIFNYDFDTNLFKNIDLTTLNVLTTNGFTNSIVGDPLFRDPNYTSNKLSVEENSPALNAGKISTAQQYPIDYYGKPRGSNPTLGAIQ